MKIILLRNTEQEVYEEGAAALRAVQSLCECSQQLQCGGRSAPVLLPMGAKHGSKTCLCPSRDFLCDTSAHSIDCVSPSSPAIIPCQLPLKQPAPAHLLPEGCNSKTCLYVRQHHSCSQNACLKCRDRYHRQVEKARAREDSKLYKKIYKPLTTEINDGVFLFNH